MKFSSFFSSFLFWGHVTLGLSFMSFWKWHVLYIHGVLNFCNWFVILSVCIEILWLSVSGTQDLAGTDQYETVDPLSNKRKGIAWNWIFKNIFRIYAIVQCSSSWPKLVVILSCAFYVIFLKYWITIRVGLRIC